MSSLEIVDKGLKILNDKILSLTKILAFINKDDILLNDYIEELEHYKKQQDDFKKIKQDLEVLELVKKKDVDLGYLALCLKKAINYEGALYQYNCSHYRISLNFIEITILAKWLESNKVGD